MTTDVEWHEDPEQCVVLVTGQWDAIADLVMNENVPNLSRDDVHIYTGQTPEGFTSVLKARKSAWSNLDNEMQIQVKSYCAGFVIGFDYGKYN